MTSTRLDGIAVDCSDAATLAAFYGAVLQTTVENEAVRLNDGTVEIWFQQVENYQPPTWPTQERGQQVHLDLAVPDIEAAITIAQEHGGGVAEQRDGYHHPIIVDPDGHPICLFTSASDAPQLAGISFDCEDHLALATFYQHLVGGEIEEFDDWTNLNRDTQPELSFQHAEGYQPPTWPTQERGQQEHIDFVSPDRSGEVQRAESLGARVMDTQRTFTVLLDPAGHPFCICDERS